MQEQVSLSSIAHHLSRRLLPKSRCGLPVLRLLLDLVAAVEAVAERAVVVEVAEAVTELNARIDLVYFKQIVIR